MSNAFKTDFYQLRTPLILAATLSAAVRVHLKAIKRLKHKKTKLASWKSFPKGRYSSRMRLPSPTL